jgi:AcrR family transcriptional regulator
MDSSYDLAELPDRSDFNKNTLEVMGENGVNDRAGLKKKQILDAALECFLQYGYSKCSFKDVAKGAKISRASLYLYFKNKRDLYVTLNRELHDRYAAESMEILKSGKSDKEKLTAIIDVWIVDPYKVLKGTSHTNDLMDGLVYISNQSEIRFRELFIKSIAPLVGEDIAEIIVLSIRGLIDDRPPIDILRQRIGLLTESLPG